MGSLKKYYFGKSKIKYGNKFAFSTYRINPLALYPAQIVNSVNSFLDVGFDGDGIIDTSAVTVHAGGSNALFSRLYDQFETTNYISVEQATGTVNPRPLATNTSFNGINYWRDTAQVTGLYKYGNLPLAMSKDYIVNYVFRNELNGNSRRLNFIIRTDAAKQQGICSICILPNVSINVKYLYSNRGLQAPDVTYPFPVGTSNTTFVLLTFAYIQGIFKYYRNGIEIAPGGSVFDVGGINVIGVIIGMGSSDMLGFPNNPSSFGGKINEFKTLSLYTGENLSGFDIAGYISSFKTIHGII